MTRLPVVVAVALSIVPAAALAQSTPPPRTQSPPVLARIQFGARAPVGAGRATPGTAVEFARFGRGERGTPASTRRRDAAAETPEKRSRTEQQSNREN